MKCIILLTLVAFAYSAVLPYTGVGTRKIHIKEDGTVATLTSPTGKKVILIKPVDVLEPRYIEVIVEEPAELIQKYHIDTWTGLPIAVQQSSGISKVIPTPQYGKVILRDILEDVFDEEMMFQVEKYIQTGILNHNIVKVLKLWQQQLLEQELYQQPITTTGQAMKYWIMKEQQQRPGVYPFSSIYQQFGENNEVPFLKYGQQYQQLYMPRTPLGRFQQLAYLQPQVQGSVLATEAPVLIELEKEMEFLQQDAKYHSMQGHDALALKELQQWQQLDEQEVALEQNIRQKHQIQGENLRYFWNAMAKQHQNLGGVLGYSQQENIYTPWQQQTYGLNPLKYQQQLRQTWGIPETYQQYGYGPQVGGWEQQMMIPQQVY